MVHMGSLGFPDSSAGKESACNAGDPGSIPGSGRSAGEGIGYPLQVFSGFPCGSAGKESACNVEDLALILGLGRFPGEGNDCPLQYSCLENSMDRGAWWTVVHALFLGAPKSLQMVTAAMKLKDACSLEESEEVGLP